MANEQEQVAPSPESQEQPTPKFSDDKQTSPSNQADSQVDALLEQIRPALRKDFEEVAEKMWQSGKDKRISQHENRLDDLEGALAEYDQLRESGMSSAEAKDKMSMNRTLTSLKDEIAQLKGGDSPEASGRSEKDWTSEEQSILSNVGKSANDPEFAEFVRSQEWESPDQYLDALRGKAFEWRTSDAKKPQPTSSSVAQTVPGATQAPRKFDEMSSTEISLQVEQLSKNYSQNKKLIDEYVSELRRRDEKE